METSKKMTSALTNLINRLEDSEQAYLEIKNAIPNPVLRDWMTKYANQRNLFQRSLTSMLSQLHVNVEPETSFSGQLHHMLIDLNLNNFGDADDSVINEMEFNASKLIDEYNRIIEEIKMPIDIKSTLQGQKAIFEQELKGLVSLRAEMEYSLVL